MACGGFRLIRAGRTQITVAADYHAEIRRLGLHRPGGLETLLESPLASWQAGGRAGRWLIELPESGRRIHLRPLAHGGLLRRITGRRLLSLGRPLAELRVAADLLALGAEVPDPVFVVGRRRGIFWKASLATAFETQSESGAEFLRSHGGSPRMIRAARAAGHAVRRFHDVGGRHPDLHIDNLLVCTNGESRATRIVVTDLDGVRVAREVTARQRMAELMRLYRSLCKRGLLGASGSRGCAAFFGGYCGGDRDLRAALLTHLRREQLRVAAHSLAYRSRDR
jgi:hypothetical protein